MAQARGAPQGRRSVYTVLYDVWKNNQQVLLSFPYALLIIYAYSVWYLSSIKLICPGAFPLLNFMVLALTCPGAYPRLNFMVLALICPGAYPRLDFIVLALICLGANPPLNFMVLALICPGANPPLSFIVLALIRPNGVKGLLKESEIFREYFWAYLKIRWSFFKCHITVGVDDVLFFADTRAQRCRQKIKCGAAPMAQARGAPARGRRSVYTVLGDVWIKHHQVLFFSILCFNFWP